MIYVLPLLSIINGKSAMHHNTDCNEGLY